MSLSSGSVVAWRRGILRGCSGVPLQCREVLQEKETCDRHTRIVRKQLQDNNDCIQWTRSMYDLEATQWRRSTVVRFEVLMHRVMCPHFSAPRIKTIVRDWILAVKALNRGMVLESNNSV